MPKSGVIRVMTFVENAHRVIVAVICVIAHVVMIRLRAMSERLVCVLKVNQ